MLPYQPDHPFDSSDPKSGSVSTHRALKIARQQVFFFFFFNSPPIYLLPIHVLQRISTTDGMLAASLSLARHSLPGETRQHTQMIGIFRLRGG